MNNKFRGNGPVLLIVAVFFFVSQKSGDAHYCLLEVKKGSQISHCIDYMSLHSPCMGNIIRENPVDHPICLRLSTFITQVKRKPLNQSCTESQQFDYCKQALHAPTDNFFVLNLGSNIRLGTHELILVKEKR